MTCPCGLGAELETCCLPLIKRESRASTCESLMRSRYTAFVVASSDYLASTWHPTTRPKTITLHPDIKWLGLKIIETRQGLAQHHAGTVEFVARSKLNGKGHRLHELSLVGREDGLWYYLDGALKTGSAGQPKGFHQHPLSNSKAF